MTKAMTIDTLKTAQTEVANARRDLFKRGWDGMQDAIAELNTPLVEGFPNDDNWQAYARDMKTYVEAINLTGARYDGFFEQEAAVTMQAQNEALRARIAELEAK